VPRSHRARLIYPETVGADTVGVMGNTKVAPAGPKFNMAELLNKKSDLQKVTATVHDLVAISFITHPVNHQTQAEVARRGKYVIDTFRMLRRDKGFSQSRALDTLPHALKAFLNSEPWEPPAERLYRTAG
jgi:hypothetical protein